MPALRPRGHENTQAARLIGGRDSLESNPPDVAVVAFAKQQIAVVIHGDRSAFADFRDGWIIEEGAVAVVGESAGAVQQQVDNAGSGMAASKVSSCMEGLCFLPRLNHHCFHVSRTPFRTLPGPRAVRTI